MAFYTNLVYLAAYVSTSLCSDLSIGCEKAEGQKVTERWYEWRKIIRENFIWGSYLC